MGSHEHEHATAGVARFGAKANALLGVAQCTFAAITGNSGFYVEAGHQASDAASFEAKARAMSDNTDPKRVSRLRKLAVSALFAGSAAGFVGGGLHFINGTKENSDPVELVGAGIGALVNTAIAERSHRHNGIGKSKTGAQRDTHLHIVADVSTSWLYAGSLAAEHVVPGITNYTLMLNGAIIGHVALDTARHIHHENPNSQASIGDGDSNS